MVFQNEKEAKFMVDFYQFLSEHRIDYKRYDHPAVYTVDDVKRLVPPLPAAIPATWGPWLHDPPQ